MKIGIIQQHNSADIADNRARIAEQIRLLLAAEGAQLIVNRELHDSLYFCLTENVDLCSLATPLPSEVTSFYSDLARQTNTVIVHLCLKNALPDCIIIRQWCLSATALWRANTARCISRTIRRITKNFILLRGSQFEPIDTSVGRLGVLVCWDQWYPEAARLHILRGAELLIYPTAIGWEAQTPRKAETAARSKWITVQRAHAVA